MIKEIATALENKEFDFFKGVDLYSKYSVNPVLLSRFVKGKDSKQNTDLLKSELEILKKLDEKEIAEIKKKAIEENESKKESEKEIKNDSVLDAERADSVAHKFDELTKSIELLIGRVDELEKKELIQKNKSK